MAAGRRSIDVVGGKIRVACPRCSKIRYADVTAGTRRRNIRCSCGKSASYMINFRKSVRESTSGRAQALINAKEAKIMLCDSSQNGMGFIIAAEFAHSLSVGQEIVVKYRAGLGGASQRKIRIRNISGTRIGSQYT